VNFRRLVAIVTLLAIFTMALRISVANDTWWHLRAGEWILDNGRLLRVDPFSLTRQGQAWIYPGWLAEIGMALLFRWLGYGGLNLLTATAVLVAFAFLWRIVQAPPLVKGFSFVLAAAVSGVYWSARPHVLSFALTGAFLWALARIRRDGRSAIWLAPALMALWVNLHGGFVIGLLLLAVELASVLLDRFGPAKLQLPSEGGAGHNLRHLLGASMLSLLTVSLNPNGPVMLLYPWKTVSVGVLRDYIQEWQSPDFHSLQVQPFLWMLFLTFAFMAISPKRPTWRQLLTVGLFGYMGFLAARNIALFGLIALPALVDHSAASSQSWIPGPYGSRPLTGRAGAALNTLLLGLVALAALLKARVPMSLAANEAAVRDREPVAAVEFLASQQPPGPLFNSYNWGSYVIWRLYPDYLSFVDGRTDLFDDEILEQYLALWRADQGWEQLVRRWDLRLALLEPKAPLSAALRQAGWASLYQDDQSIILAAPSE
jgi:hypothetical protein